MSDKPKPSSINTTKEDDYFFRRDQELLKKLRVTSAEDERHQAFELATGVSDPALLKELSDLGVSVASVAAMSLIPMVLVAWSDGKLDAKERAAVVKISGGKGISPGSPAHELLEHWLSVAPADDMPATWERYMKSIVPRLSDSGRETLKQEMLDHCRATAKAAGGVFGIGSISDAEENAIARITAAF